ncbi:MAG: hypothetical protein H6760_02580 [Candidatus Nomurabacteria bacterium]|nr:MAG: hypothetical protein H6760_02580 [Candidatus Nomurabacteria bacterium]
MRTFLIILACLLSCLFGFFLVLNVLFSDSAGINDYIVAGAIIFAVYLLFSAGFTFAFPSLWKAWTGIWLVPAALFVLLMLWRESEQWLWQLILFGIILFAVWIGAWLGKRFK